MRNVQGTAEVEDAGDAIVSSLGRVESAERVGARIEGGVIIDGRESAVVETPAVVLRLPKAWSSENCDVAALLTLPLTSKPSDDCWFTSSAGFGISATLSLGEPGAAGVFGLMLSEGTGVGGSLVNLVIWSSGSSVNSHFPGGVAGEMVISAWTVEKHCISTSMLPGPSARSAKV